MSRAPDRALLLAGGVSHPAEASVPALTEVLRQQGLATDVEEDITQGCRRLAQGGYPLLVVSALRWRMAGAKYDAHRARWGFDMPEPARESLRAHLRGGGALLALHTASICFDDWPEWGDIVGGRWVWGESGHDPAGGVEVRFDRSVPDALTAGLTDYTCEDEVYERLALAPGIVPLAQARSRTGKDGGPGHWAPVLWKHQWQGGRVLYDALGHDARSLDHPVHRELLGRAVRWLLQP